MKLGFTGSQEGGGWMQLQSFIRAVAALRPSLFVHGDCIGWDAIAAMHVAQHHPRCRIVKYPSNIPGKIANAPGIEGAPPQNPLDRNWDIVKTTWVLLACPKAVKEEIGSGTWSTVRKARKQDKPIVIVNPDGSFDFERCDKALRVGPTMVDLFGATRGLR